MTAPADPGTQESLDWLPDVAVRAGRALQPVLTAFGRDDPLDELARQAAGFAADPPVVAITAVAAAYGLIPSVTSCAPEQLATLVGPSVAIIDGQPVCVGPTWVQRRSPRRPPAYPSSPSPPVASSAAPSGPPEPSPSSVAG